MQQSSQIELQAVLQSVGDFLRRARKQRGLTQAELTQKLGINYRHYQDLERGKSNFKIETVHKICQFFNVSMAEIFSQTLSNRLYETKASTLLNGKSNSMTEESMRSMGNQWNDYPTPVMLCDKQGRLIGFNRAFEEMLGYTSDELRSMTIYDFTSKEDEKEYLKKYMEFLSSEEPPPKVFFSENKGKAGDTFPVRVDWSYVKNTSNNLLGYLCLVERLPH